MLQQLKNKQRKQWVIKMKLLVDEMPGWRGDCPFAEEKWEHCYWTYICKLTNKSCDLYEIEDTCQMLKKIG